MTEMNFTSDFFWDPASPISAEELTRKRMQRERQKLHHESDGAVSAKIVKTKKSDKPDVAA